MNRLIMKCGLFGRVSTSWEAKAEEGELNIQFNRMEEFVKLKDNNDPRIDWVVSCRYREVAEYELDLGRPEFDRIIRDVKDGKIDTVIVCKTNRIARSIREFFALWGFLYEHNVQFISLDEITDVVLNRAL